MNYRGLIDSGLTLAELNAEQVTYTETWVRWTTIANQFGAAVADQVYTMLKSMSAPRAAVFISPGFDMSSAVTRAEMAQMAAIPEAAPVIAWCLEQGKTIKRACEDFGYATVSEANLAEARRRIEMDEQDAALQAYCESYYAKRDAYIAGTGEKPVVG